MISRKSSQRKVSKQTAKKDDMLRALFLLGVKEEGLAKRKAELGSKSLQELKELLSRHGLETGSKEQMVKTVLAHEEKCRTDLEAFENKVSEVVVLKKQELETKTNAALKDECVAKGLPVGGGKEERIERLVEEIKVSQQGELDKIVSRDIRNKRKEELMAMEKVAVLKLCEEKAVDPMVKDIMVERIISHEGEGELVIAMSDDAPAAKRARK